DRATDATAPAWELGYNRPAEGTLVVRMSGRWRLRDRLPPPDEVRREIESGPPVHRVELDAQGVTEWDTGLLTFVRGVIADAEAASIDVDRAGLPEGARRLLTLAAAVPERAPAPPPAPASWLARVGVLALSTAESAVAMIAFIGAAVLALVAFARGRARFQAGDLALTIQECGPRALPIVTLISFLVGLILAFVGALQL